MKFGENTQLCARIILEIFFLKFSKSSFMISLKLCSWQVSIKKRMRRDNDFHFILNHAEELTFHQTFFSPISEHFFSEQIYIPPKDPPKIFWDLQGAPISTVRSLLLVDLFFGKLVLKKIDTHFKFKLKKDGISKQSRQIFFEPSYCAHQSSELTI